MPELVAGRKRRNGEEALGVRGVEGKKSLSVTTRHAAGEKEKIGVCWSVGKSCGKKGGREKIVQISSGFPLRKQEATGVDRYADAEKGA